MARCGCSSTCACAVQGSAGITVTGNGSVDSPYVISVDFTNPVACPSIMDCVGSNAGPGIVYDGVSHDIAVRISHDPNNAASFGSDGGIFATGSGVPGASCFNTVASLPAGPNVLGGTDGLGASVAPYGGIRDSFVRGAAHDLNLMSVATVVRLMDGTFAVGPTSLDTDDVSPRMTAPLISAIGLPQWRQERSNVLTWYGMGEDPQEGLTTLDEVIRINGKAVSVLVLQRQGTMVGRHTELRDWLIARCMTQRVIIALFPDDWASASPVYTAAGIATMAWIIGSGDATAGPPSAAVAAGITWAAVADLGDATLLGYKNAGLQTLMYGGTRQVQKTRVTTTLGLRGVLSHDPAYYSGKSLARASVDTWLNPANPSGQISPNLDANQVRDTRGQKVPDPSEDGWEMQANPGVRNNSLLLGWANVPSNGVQVTEVQVNFPTMPPSQLVRLGIIVCATTDAAAASSGDATNFLSGASGYAVCLGSNGTLDITRIAPGGTGTVIGTPATGGAPTAGVWNKIRVTVTSTTIAAQLLSQTDVVLRNIAAVTDTTFRGPYVHLYKQQGTAAVPIVYAGQHRRFLRIS